MIRKLLATTALATLVASGAYAQETPAPAPAPAAPATENAAPVAPVAQAEGNLVTNIVGESVYNGPGDDAESIGTVSDIVFDQEGQARQLVIGVGGFLGIGTKKVAFDYDQLKWAEKNGDRWLVAETSKEALTALPDFDETPYEPAPAPAPATDSTMAPGGTAAPGIAGAPTTPDSGTAAPADTAGTAPADTGQAAPADTAQTMPDSTTEGAPEGAPADMAQDTQSDMSQEAPADTAQTMPDSTTEGAPADMAQDMQPDMIQDAPADMAQDAPAGMAQGMLASNLLGESVYNGAGDNAENIGSVNDIVLNKEGKAEQYVIGVGGFLGVGQKNVAFDFEKASWVERDGDRWIVVEGTKEQLQALAEFDPRAYDPAPATTAAGSETPATVTPAVDTADNATDDDVMATQDQTADAPAASDDAMATQDQTADAPATDDVEGTTDATQTAAIDRTTLTEVPADKISADTLIGTTVYGANDAVVGEIGDVVLSSDNSIDAVVVDVGGFLGIGEKPVAIGMDKLKFMADADGDQYLYTNFTEEQLEAQAAYDESSYVQNRDAQRMTVQ